MSQRGFTWGVATASFQIEGSTQADGRLPSIWDTFCATPGKVLGGDTGEPGCDHYRRADADVDLIADLGVDAYRLSIAWPRVMHVDGTPNEAGIAFYVRLLDRLASRGLKAMVTLYHWDLPQHLEDAGGWLNRETAYRFAEYADLMSRRLAGKVHAWATLNEPWCSAFLGYGNGHHAPGKSDPKLATQAMHHLLLGHGLALAHLQANDPGARRGIVANIGRGGTPGAGPGGGTTGSAEDLDAVRLFEMQHNDWVLQPLLQGCYPQELFDRLWPGSQPVIHDGDLAVISRPIDFLGINYYFRSTVKADGRGGFDMVERPGVELTQMGWEVHPQGLEELLVGFKARYANLPPIHITENGMSSDDHVVDAADGPRVPDAQRTAYLRRHFEAIDRAIRAGVDVQGYYVWSLMDNFEWAFGYERRFGLVHVDYTTQVRTLKDSARHFRDFLHRRRAGAGT